MSAGIGRSSPNTLAVGQVRCVGETGVGYGGMLRYVLDWRYVCWISIMTTEAKDVDTYEIGTATKKSHRRNLDPRQIGYWSGLEACELTQSSVREHNYLIRPDSQGYCRITGNRIDLIGVPQSREDSAVGITCAHPSEGSSSGLVRKPLD